MRWAAQSHLDFKIPRGYFMGPANAPSDTTGSWHAPNRFTSELLTGVFLRGKVPHLTPADRLQIRADLIYWRAAVVVLVPNGRNSNALKATLTDALGKAPERVGGTDIWDVRSLPVPPQG